MIRETKPIPKKEVPKVFTYYFRNRPPDIGTFPKGAIMKEAWIPKRATEKGNLAWGWASYERELTSDELYNYELFVDEIVMPKLVKELIKFTHDEGIYEGFKELKSTIGWSEYGIAFRNWLKANNEWKTDKGEEAEFLRHLARLTGKTEKPVVVLSAEELQKTQFFKDQLSYLLHNLDKGYQQRVEDFVKGFNKEFAPSKNVITKYVVEQAVSNEKRVTVIPEGRKRVLWQGKDFTEVTAKIERRKLGEGWEVGESPYEKGRFIVFRYEDPELEKAKLFISTLSRLTLNELLEQEATVRRWSIQFPQMEKELEDEYKMYLELRRAEKTTQESARKEKASKPHTEQGKELYKQMRKTNSVRELDDWRNRVLFEAHLLDVDEDILLRDLAAKWRTYLDARGTPALEALDKLPLDHKNKFYYFGTEVWIHPTTTIIKDQPLKGKLHQALNEGQLFEVDIEGREGTQRTQIERIYVTKVVEKPEPRHQPQIKAVTTIERPVFNPEQAIKIAADSIEQLRRVDVFRVLNTYSNKSKELGDYIKSKRPDLVAEVDKILGVPHEVQPKEETPYQLYAKLFSDWNPVSKGAQAKVSDKNMIYFISTQLKIPPEKASKLSWIFKQKLQDDYNEAMSKAKAEQEAKRFEEEKQAKANELKFWDEVKNLKVVDFEVEHDINPDKPTRTYYHVYDRTYAILENGKKVQISYDINKGEEGKRAAKATKEFYRKFYDRHVGKPLSEWIGEYNESFINTNMIIYKSQKPKPRFTFIPEETTPQEKGQVLKQPIDLRMLRQILNKAIREPIDPNKIAAENNIPSTIVIGMIEYKTYGEKGIDYTYRQMNQGHLNSVDEWLVKMNHPLSKGTSTQEYRFKYIIKTLFIPDQPTLSSIKPTQLVAMPAAKPQSTQDIKQKYTLKFQLAKSLDELQTIKNEIAFLQIPQADKIHLIDVFSKRYASFAMEIPFGTRIPPKMQEKARILGAQTPQQRFEEEQHRKAAEEKRTRGQQKLTAVGSKRLSEFGIREPMRRYY